MIVSIDVACHLSIDKQPIRDEGLRHDGRLLWATAGQNRNKIALRATI
jgi:hypothetical protein